MLFDLHPIWGLVPLLLYVILSFKEKLHPIFNVTVCVILSAILTKQDFSSFGSIISESLGSFLGMFHSSGIPSWHSGRSKCYSCTDHHSVGCRHRHYSLHGRRCFYGGRTDQHVSRPVHPSGGYHYGTYRA